MVTISALGKMVLPGFSLYDATKFAMDGFVRTYRMENPKNISKSWPVYPVATLKTGFFKKAGGERYACSAACPQPVGIGRVVYGIRVLKTGCTVGVHVSSRS